MDHFSQFVTNHWLLCGAFVLVMLAIFYFEARTQGAVGGGRVTPQVATQMMNHEMAVVVDLRDVKQFREGHIIGSLSLPIKEWQTQQKKLDKFKGKPVILVDAMGQKAQAQANKLKQAGFENVKILAGGVNAWKNAKLPLTKGNR